VLAGITPVLGADSGPNHAMLTAYAAMNYTQAGKLAKQIPDTPEGRLIAGLCNLYDRGHQDIQRGQTALAKLFNDEKAPLSYRVEAGVALGRTAQLMKERRDLYGDAADRYDHIGIFDTVRKLAPGSSFDRDAFFYLMREKLEDPERRDAAFKEFEAYFQDFKGDRALLSPLYLLAEYEYIRTRQDYRSAVRHLAAGYEIGFANPSENRSALFRLAYFFDTKLHDKPMAVKYFNEYLTRYPYSGEAVVAKRFLQELGEDGANK